MIDIIKHLAKCEELARVAEALADHCDTNLDTVDDEQTAASILREGVDADIINEDCGDFYEEVVMVLYMANSDYEGGEE
jgi:hypothetical protein